MIAKPAEKRKTVNTKNKAVKTSSSSNVKIKPVEKKSNVSEKNDNSGIRQSNEQQDMSLPEGNALKQTGHRRPLIVFPK